MLDFEDYELITLRHFAQIFEEPDNDPDNYIFFFINVKDQDCWTIETSCDYGAFLEDLKSDNVYVVIKERS